MNPGRRTARRARLVLTGCVAAVLMAACGGGTSQFEAFQPEEYVAFGDETSLIRADGKRYTVNPLTTNGAVDCLAEPIWTQAVANQYTFVFQECNPDNATVFKAKMRATAGAQVADLTAQIDAVVANGGFAAKTLATVLVGANDVLAAYARFPQQSEEALATELRAKGVALAGQVNRLVDLGVRVIVSTAPDMGFSPYALQQKAAHTDTDRAALLSRLTSAFNGRVRVNILNDGRFVGLVLGDEVVQSIARLPALYAITDVTTAVCSTPTPDCTTQTLVSTGSSATWLWADDRHLAFGGQTRLGSLAVSRAIGNPF